LVDERKHAMSEIEAGLNTINKQISKILGEAGIDSAETDDATGSLMELKDDRNEYDDSVEKISDLKKRQKSSESKLATKKKAKDGMIKELGDIKNKITEFEESINSLPDYEAELKSVESKERKIDSGLLGIANDLGEIRSQIENKEEEKTNTELEIKESEKWNKKYKKLGDYYTWLKEFFIN